MNDKIKELWDTLVWYTVYKPKEIYKKVRHWYRLNASNPYHWKLVWYTIFKHYGWDSSFNMEVLQLCIKKSIYYFEHFKYISEAHINQTLKWERIAVSLLDIILEKRELYTYEYSSEPHVYTCIPYVNKKNMNRFALPYYMYETREIGHTIALFEKEPHELYKEKARQLLLKIFSEHSIEWWD